MNLKQSIQTANWPTESGVYKCVQLEIDCNPYLRIGDEPKTEETRSFHKLIFKYALEEFDIREYETLPTFPGASSHLRPLQKPKPEGERYKLVGTGRIEVDVNKKLVLGYGSSQSYPDILFNQSHLDEVLELEQEWKRAAL